MMKAAIVGLSGPALLAEEGALLRAAPPAGVILFSRNIEGPAQLAALMQALRGVLSAGAVLMVDQEGGRVARLRPPHWRAHPPAAAIGRLHETDPDAGLRAAWLQGALIGIDCAAAGFTVATAPMLDLHVPGASNVVGDRAFATAPDAVAALGRACAEGLLAAGVMPVGKHAPGHGRARVDSHESLPEVGAEGFDDGLVPFIANADLPWMMTAHILYTALDADRPATLSARVIERIIRGRIGFGGLLVSDDLGMGALSGAPAERAAAAITAGCDIALHCSGVPAETEAVLEAVPALAGAAQARLAAAQAKVRRSVRDTDGAALAAERDRLLA